VGSSAARGRGRPTAEVMPGLVLRIPALPDTRLSTNSRDGKLNRFERADLVKAAIEGLTPVALAWANRAGILAPLQGPLALRWTLYVAAWRGDADGWAGALKPWTDCLVRLGILAGDGPRIVREVTYRVERDEHLAPMTTLELEEAS